MKEEKMRKKSKVSQKNWLDLLAVGCLLAVAVVIFYGMQHIFFKDDYTKKQKGKKEQIVSETWCTLKSNALDGVPIYPAAGETLQSGLLPEGKCCHLEKLQKIGGEVWAKVSYCGLNGWLEKKRIHFISERECSIKEGDTIYVNALSEKGICGYEKPSAQSKIIIENIKYGTEYKIVKLYNGWGQVEQEEKKFWINMYYVGSYPIKSWKVKTLSTVAEINLRKGPGEKKKSIGKVPEDTRIWIKTFRRGWGKIRYHGQTGWVMLHYLIPVKDNGEYQ